MRRANFIVGFNNWGKTTIVSELFNGQQKFYYAYSYRITGINAPLGFMVQSQSNDDVGMNLVNQIAERINRTQPRISDLFAALCPSMEQGNNFIDVLLDPTFDIFDEFNFFLIKNKWEHHAELNTSKIIAACSHLRPNMRFHIIDEGNIPVVDRINVKLNQIKSILASIYP
jgi:hypothetical protein